MADSLPRREARQPFTFPGVARFAHSSFRRLFFAGTVVALLCGAAIGFCIVRAWMPVLNAAVNQLPATGTISNGRLIWPGRSGVELAANRFLALSVTPVDQIAPRHAADIYADFQASRLLLHSLAGTMPLPYPAGWSIPFNKPEVAPFWGAWKGAFVPSAALMAAAGLMLTWSLLATLCIPVPRVLGFYLDRDVSLAGCWKLSFAAMLPGALFMAFGIVIYALGEINLVLLCVFGIAHLLLDIVYVLFAPFALPANEQAIKKNPFRVDDGAERSRS